MTPAARLRLAELIYAQRGGRCGTTMRQAQRESGISPSTLSRLERCQKLPDVETLIKLCRWLGRSADDLLGLLVFPAEGEETVCERKK